MEILTLKECIDWMDRSLFDGVNTESEEFWSNFSDVLMYLRCYENLLNQMLTYKEKKSNGKSMEN